jgi:hypothetical protein
MVVVGDVGLIRALLALPNERFRYDTPLSPFPTVVGRSSMLASDGDEHRRRRGAVAGSLSRRRLAQWIPMIVDRTDAAIDDLLAARCQPARPVRLDLYPVGRRLVLDIVVRALFGAQLIDQLDEIDVLQRSGQRFLGSPVWRQWSPAPWGVRAAARRDRDRLDAIIGAAIDSIRTGDHSGRTDVLDHLVRNSGLDDAEIRDQVKTLIGAGFDTTASTLAWTLLEATLQRGLWTRLRAEADAVLGPAGEAGTADEDRLAALSLAGATVRETLRLHPASGVAARSTAVDVEVGEFAIARNTWVVWSPYLTGRDPKVWDDPLAFEPDRFLSGNADGVGDPDERRTQMQEAWLPFGRGARMCVGFALAQMELTLIVARLAQRLDLGPTLTQVPPARGLVVSLPEGGAPLTVALRP